MLRLRKLGPVPRDADAQTVSQLKVGSHVHSEENHNICRLTLFGHSSGELSSPLDTVWYRRFSGAAGDGQGWPRCSGLARHRGEHLDPDV